MVVERLIERMFALRIIHIRGTPASGKTTLATLVELRLASRFPNYRTTFARHWPSEKMTASESEKYLEGLLNGSYMDVMTSQDRVLLLDEAQTSYHDMFFWNTFLKGIHRLSGPYVMLFSSYGNPSQSPLGSDVAGTPAAFAPGQRISLRWESVHPFPAVGLLLSEEEANDVINRSAQGNQDRPIYTGGLKEDLYTFTEGHVGALSAMSSVIETDLVYHRFSHVLLNQF